MIEGGLEVLLLSLVIGMQHALEADHIAAVSSIAARQTNVRRIVALGAVWGLGHTVALMAIVGCVVVFGVVISDDLIGWLELLVGIMLVGLGAHLVFALASQRLPFPRSRRNPATMHFKTLSRSEPASPHSHKLSVRTLLVGMIHGMAGSAALLVLMAATLQSVPLALGYILLFGLGSIVGMAILSVAVAVPLTFSARSLSRVNYGLQGCVGLATVVLGTMVITEKLTGS